MRAGLVLDDTLDTQDGVQQYVLTTGSWLRDQGHDVHYLVGQTVRTDPQLLDVYAEAQSARSGARRATAART